MTKLKLVTSPAVEPPAPKKSRVGKPSVPNLLDMSHEERRAYVLEAHDALLAFTIPELDITVKEALIMARQMGDDTPYKITKKLRSYGLAHQISSERVNDMLEFAKSRLEHPEIRPVMGIHLPMAAVDSAVEGESPYPIGYVVQYPDTPYVTKDIKPILKYFDVLAGPTWLKRGVFPLYNESYKHLLDIDTAIANYYPTAMNKAQRNYDANLERASLEDKLSVSPDAASREAHAAILNTSLGSKTIREAIMFVRAEDAKERALDAELEALEDADFDIDEDAEAQEVGSSSSQYNRKGSNFWRSLLGDIGIAVQPVDTDFAAVIFDPARLFKAGPYQQSLRVYKKVIGKNSVEALDIQFKLYC